MRGKAGRLKWGILGTGSISHAVAKALGESETGELYAVGSRSQESADKWGLEQGYALAKRYGSYEALLADPEVDAVYVALPNHVHARWTVLAAEAGKHILCEKPLASNGSELMVMLEACRRHKVFFMEAFMWRCHPGTAEWLQLVRNGAVGEVRMIDAQFSFNLRGNQTHTRMRNDLSGGGIMDVGCYCLSAARLVAGAALGKDFAEPTAILGAGHVGRTNVDEWAAATLRFPGDILANVSAGIQLLQKNEVRIWGSEGHMIVPSPWFADGKAVVCRDGEEARTHDFASEKTLYTHEVEMLGRCVGEGRLEAYPPAMTWDDSRGQQEAVDRWRKSAGVVFDVEKEEALRQTITGRPVAARPDANMPHGRIKGLDKPVARVMIGSMALRADDMPYTCAMLDDYFERGGNAADSAYVYGPRCEGALGKWINLRGVRDRFVILAKGAHTAGGADPYKRPGCDPETLTRELFESLDRLQTDYVDIYCMHRDNPTIPVGEFVDVLNEHVAAGRIRVFGGSNWTIARFEEANAYAARNGRQGFSVLSNNLSLARWNEPMWALCLTSSDPESRQWFEKTRTPLLAWSSQAAGFFTGRYRREDKDDPALAGIVRVWFSDDNFERLDRARQLAAEKGVTATQIALAYVLCQPMEIYALIGPHSIEETRTSLEALDVELSPEEMAWLNLEQDSLAASSG